MNKDNKLRMRISNITIKKLYGIYDYDINLPKSDVFLITGPNGYGKTTILSIIDKLLHKEFVFFLYTEFEMISIQFDSGYNILIKKYDKLRVSNSDDEDGITGQGWNSIFYLTSEPDGLEFKYSLDYEKIEKEYRKYCLKAPTEREIDRGLYDNTYNWKGLGKKDAIEDLLENMIIRDPEIYARIAKDEGVEQFLVYMKQLDCSFLAADKRLNYAIEKISSVEDVCRRFEKYCRRNYSYYLEKAQVYDNEMLSRILKFDSSKYSKEEYEALKFKIEDKIKKMKFFGVDSNIELREYNLQKADVLSAHIDTIRKKVEFCYTFLGAIDLFYQCIQKKCFSNKDIRISRNGIEFLSKGNGYIIPPDKLSSGEKNEIIMFYYLIFEVKNASILLIDEPEISLHISWQDEFVSEIETIASLKGLQVITATHSPSIIGGRWNETFDLFEQGVTHDE